MKTKTLIAQALSTLGILFFLTPTAFAQTYSEPSSGNTLLGKIEYVASSSDETLTTIAQKYDVGVSQILAANPGIKANTILQPGTEIEIPKQFILPPLAHDGIVINLPEMRMYYYPRNSKGVVLSYPIGIGRVGKTIPIKRTAVVRKVKNPIWIPPDDIRAFNKEQGITLPHVMAAGPDNPLGPYAIYLQIPTYLIHSTIYPDSIGRRASFGCIRMHKSDIESFFPLVTPGTSVVIVDMPTKAGWQGNKLYMETHEPLEEHSTEPYATYGGVVTTVDNATQGRHAFVDWQLVSFLAEQHDGLPEEVGYQLN